MARKPRTHARTRTRARAREDSAKKTPEMVRLVVSQIVVDSEWNVRDAMGSAKPTEGETENPDAEFSDAEFVEWKPAPLISAEPARCIVELQAPDGSSMTIRIMDTRGVLAALPPLISGGQWHGSGDCEPALSP